MSGGLVWGKKCDAVLLGRAAHGLQGPCAEVAPRAVCRSCAPGMGHPYVCESRSMRVGVQRTRSREVFGGGPVECMGAVYLHVDRRLSMLMQGECMGAGTYTWTESYRHRYNLEARGKRVGKSVNMGHRGDRG